LSEGAYVASGDSAWKPITPAQLKTLKEKSAARVEKNEEFKKMIDEISKSKERGKTIRVSEVLKDKNEKEKKARAAKNAKKEEKNKEYLKRADLNEAVQVLIDLMLLEDPKLASRRQ
jgi:carboxyl-terminal processing protease